MSGLGAALHVEVRKAMASNVLRTTTVLIVLGVAVLAGALVAGVRAGNEQVVAQLGHLSGLSGWHLLSGVTAQITAAGGLLAFGIALSWTFGREFGDGTVTGLFAVPVSRPVVAVAKLLVHLGWVVLVALALTGLVLAAGLALDLGPVDSAVLGRLARQLALTVLTGLIAVPAGWAATLGRGLLPGVATTVGVLVVAQVSVIAAPAAAAWLPFSTPALWALQPHLVDGAQLAVVVAVPAVFGALTAVAWSRLQLDR